MLQVLPEPTVIVEDGFKKITSYSHTKEGKIEKVCDLFDHIKYYFTIYIKMC